MNQFGTSPSDDLLAAAPDGSCGAFVGGETWGNLVGSNSGSGDAWLARYDEASQRLWLVQFGSTGTERVTALAVDGAGGVYATGYTSADLFGPHAGSTDVWLARYDGAGNQLWTRQLGTSGSESAQAAAPDGAGGVYVLGSAYGSFGGPSLGSGDVWLARYDALGSQLWIRQFGTASSDAAAAAAPDGSGGVFVGGSTYGSLGGSNPDPSGNSADGWLARYDGSGNSVWARQLGTAVSDSLSALASDASGGVYAGGQTSGNLGGPQAGQGDGWLARYDNNGVQGWVRQLGTGSIDRLNVAALDGFGGVYVGGQTQGSFAATNAGSDDAWLARYDNAGFMTWSRQFGTSNADNVWAATADGAAGVYFGGSTFGSLGAPNPTFQDDAWLTHYEGAAWSYCTAGTTTNGCVPSISFSGAPRLGATSGFHIVVHDVEGQRAGLIFYGTDNSSWTPLSWASGSGSYLCVKPPTQRTPPHNSGGFAGGCNGTLSVDWNAFRTANPGALGQPFAAGQHLYAQGWFRDPAAPKTTNLSDGLEFVVQP